MQPPNRYQFITCHMIFDVKMEYFCWKVRLVAGGDMTDVTPTVMYATVVSRPPPITYVSVLSQETVRIALTMAALDALK